MLKSGINLLTDDRIQANVMRVLNIWSERGIYSQPTIQELKCGILQSEPVSNESSLTTQIMAEFQLAEVVESVNEMQRIEKESASAQEEVNPAKLNVLNAEILTRLKDKTLGDHLIREADEASRLIEKAIRTMEREHSHRSQLINILTKALVFYVTQNSEVDQEFKAYVRIGQNAAKVLTTLTSPRSYPPIPTDVPSPTNSDDGQFLPLDAEGQKKHATSLDQRLETILCGIKSTNAPTSTVNTTTATTSYNPAAAGTSDQITRYQTPTASHYDVSHMAQPIQSLVSPRTGISQNPSGGSVIPPYGVSENLEPADMDITNSDEDEPYVPAPGPRGPNLRVIEPVRMTGYASNDQRNGPYSMPPAQKNKSRDHQETTAWQRMSSGRFSPRSSSTVPTSNRWSSVTSRARHSDGGRQSGRRSGNFRHS